MAYRIEYASSGRAGCKGPKACKDSGESNKIPKEALRLGSVVDIQGNTTFMWRHWGCITDTVAGNIRDKVGEPADLDGYEELREEDQKRVDHMFEHGAIPEEDITPVVREEAERKEQEKEEKAAAKQRAKEEKAAAKKAASTPKKRKKAAEADEDAENAEEEEAEAEAKAPAKKRGRKAKQDADEEAGPSSSAPSTSSKRGRGSKKTKKAKSDDEEFDASSASDTSSLPASSRSTSEQPMDTTDNDPPGPSHTSHNSTGAPDANGDSKPASFTIEFSDCPDSIPPLGPHAPAPTYNAASLLSYLRESLASSPLASGYRGLNGQLRIHAIFSTPRPARDLFPLAHLDLANPDSAAGTRAPVDAYLEHILVTTSFAPNHPTQAQAFQQASNIHANGSGPSASDPFTSSSGLDSGHQMALALECFLYTLPAHRSAVLYVSKLDSTGLGPSGPQSDHVPFMSELVDEILDGQTQTTEGSQQPSTSLTRAVTTAFISYFASFQHWLPIKPIATSTYQAPFPFPPRLEKTLAARREALKKSPVRHLSVHVLARAQRCYLFPDSELNKAKRVLSDGGLIRWWRRTLSDAVFATRFEHMRALSESRGSISDHSKLTIMPYYLIPGYSKFESHPIVPLPAIAPPTSADSSTISSTAVLRKPHTKTELHPFWSIPTPGSSSLPALNATHAGGVKVVGNRGLTRSIMSPTHARSISPMWEKLGRLDERSSLAEANWTYGHPYSPEDTLSQDQPSIPTLPLYHLAAASRTPTEGRDKLASEYDSGAEARGWRSIATLLPHFEDDPKSRFVDEIARDAHEHAGSGLLRAARGAVARAKPTAFRESPAANQSTAASAGSTGTETGDAVANRQNGNGSLVLSKSVEAAEKTQKIIHAASDAAGTAKVGIEQPAPAGIHSVADTNSTSAVPQAATASSSIAASRKNAALRSQLVERAALDKIPPNEFWERMGYRQECCSGNVVGVFVVLFTLEPPVAAPNPEAWESQLLPKGPPVAQPLSLPHPMLPDLVLRNIMRDACDWSNGPSAEKLTQAWGDAVHKAVMRKGNVRKYLATGHGGSDATGSNGSAAGDGEGETSGKAALTRHGGSAGDGAGTASAPPKPTAWPVRSSMRIASRESNAASMQPPIADAAGTGLRRASSQTDLSSGARPSTASTVQKLALPQKSGQNGAQQEEQQQQGRAVSAPPESPCVRLQDAPWSEPGWIGFNTIWTTVALHGPPPPVVERARAKLALARPRAPKKIAGGEATKLNGDDAAAQDAAQAGVGAGASEPAQPVTILTVKKKKKQPEAA